MPTTAVQVAIWPTSNLQADATVNTWHINNGGSTGIEEFASDVADFYGDIVDHFPNTVRQNGHTIKCYDLADPVPRAPVYETTFNFPSVPSGVSLPPEVAKCLSFQADPESGVNQASQRGRVFIGPLNSGCLGTDGRAANTFVSSLLTAGADLFAANEAATDYAWCIYSPTLNDISFVSNGWVDNEFDTQRSRGRTATSRGVFPF